MGPQQSAAQGGCVTLLSSSYMQGALAELQSTCVLRMEALEQVSVRKPFAWQSVCTLTYFPKFSLVWVLAKNREPPGKDELMGALAQVGQQISCFTAGQGCNVRVATTPTNSCTEGWGFDTGGC